MTRDISVEMADPHDNVSKCKVMRFNMRKVGEVMQQFKVRAPQAQGLCFAGGSREYRVDSLDQEAMDLSIYDIWEVLQQPASLKCRVCKL